MFRWVSSWGGGCDEILAGFSLWCELHRKSCVPSRFPPHYFVLRVLRLSDVKASWAQQAGYRTVGSGPLTCLVSQELQFCKIERAGSREATEALQKRPWGFVEHGRADGLWRRWSYTLTSKTGGGAEVGPTLPGDCPRSLMSLRSDRQT